MSEPREATGSETDDVMPLVKPRRRWPLLLGLGALVAGGGVWASRSLAEPYPLRVVVAIDLEGHFWQGSRPSAALVNELCQRLDAIGLEPVRAADPAILKVLQEAKDPDDAARKLHASFVVTATLEPSVAELQNLGSGKEGSPRHGFETHLDGAIEVHYVGEEPSSKGRLQSWAGAVEKPEALRLLGRSLGAQAFDQVLPRIVEHPSIQAIFKSDNIKLADKVAKAKKYVEARASRLEEAQKTYADLEKRRAQADTGPAKVTYHSAIGAQDGLGGVSSLGVLVKTADMTPFVVPRTVELSYLSGLETLEWRKAGEPRKVIWAGYHLFSYPSLTPGGGPIAFVEDLFGWAKTITVVMPDGASRRIRTDAEHRFLDPKMAPGGAMVAVYDRACRQCGSGLSVVALSDGKTRFSREVDDGSSYSGFAWVGPEELAYLTTPKASDEEGAPSPRMELHLVDLSQSPPKDEMAYQAPEGESMSALDASRDGKVLVMEHFQSWTKLGVFDVKARKQSVVDTGLEATTPAPSPDGKLVAFTRNGDVFVWDREKKKPLRLTKNPWRERYPTFSEDGQRIYFESHSDDPLFDKRELSLIGSVAVKDAGELAEANAAERGEK